MEKDFLTGQIINAAMNVHTALGPGLLESAYEACLAHSLKKSGLSFETQKSLPVTFEGIKIDCGYRLDFLVENKVILELKAVSEILPIHHAQLLSYLRIAGLQTGLLINFHVKHLKDGIHRKINSTHPLCSSASSAV